MLIVIAKLAYAVFVTVVVVAILFRLEEDRWPWDRGAWGTRGKTK
jgi:hypothetical protein